MARESRYDAQPELTPREREVLDLLRLGLTDAEIGERLGISRPGVSYHVSEIIGKLGVRNRYEAAAWPEPPRPAMALAPLALLWRRAGALLPLNGSTLAMAASGGTLLALLGGLALIGVLLARAGADAEGDSPDDAARVQVAATGLPVLAALSPPAGLSAPNGLAPTPTPTPWPDTPTPAPSRTALPDGTPVPGGAPPPTETPTPALGPTPAPTECDQAVLARDGWLFVYFQNGVPEERAQEIVQSVGGFIIPVEQLLNPLAYPEPQPGPGEYGELVEVEPARQFEVIDLLRAYTEVTRAEAAYWLPC